MRLSETFYRLALSCENRKMSLKEFINHVGPRATAFLSLIFSVPFLFFVPIPGLSTVFGIIVLLCGSALAFGKTLWLPRWLGTRKVEGRVLAKTLRIGGKILKLCEKWARPRWRHFSRHPWVQRTSGMMLIVCGFCLLLPLPPGTNFTPGLATFLLSIAILEEDTLLLFIGYAAFLLNLTFFALLFFFGWEGIATLLHR